LGAPRSAAGLEHLALHARAGHTFLVGESAPRPQEEAEGRGEENPTGRRVMVDEARQACRQEARSPGDFQGGTGGLAEQHAEERANEASQRETGAPEAERDVVEARVEPPAWEQD